MPLGDPLGTVAHISWAEIADVVRRVADTYPSEDESALGAIRRIATSAAESVAAHS